MRLIDADAFIRFIKDVSERQKYEKVLIDKNMTVEDVLNAVVESLENEGPAEGDTPTIVSADRVIRYMERRNRMKRYFCDKCGMEITEKQYESPYVYILKGSNDFAEQVALCDECEDEFIKWLGEKNERGKRKGLLQLPT